eukprot:1308699-Rhodomonas_salina.1
MTAYTHGLVVICGGFDFDVLSTAHALPLQPSILAPIFATTRGLRLRGARRKTEEKRRKTEDVVEEEARKRSGERAQMEEEEEEKAWREGGAVSCGPQGQSYELGAAWFKLPKCRAAFRAPVTMCRVCV